MDHESYAVNLYITENTPCFNLKERSNVVYTYACLLSVVRVTWIIQIRYMSKMQSFCALKAGGSRTIHHVPKGPCFNEQQ